jgi:hypothetical protein
VLLDGAALALLALACVGFFWRVLLAGEWMPAGGGDLASFLYPSYQFAARALHRGILPLWNPYLWGGAPFAADIQASLFYPINLLVFWLSPSVSYRELMGLAIFHVWLAGAGTYLCFRHTVWLRPSQAHDPAAPDVQPAPPGAALILPPLIGALAFMFSDYFIVHLGNLNLIAQAAWFPFILLFYHRSLAEGRPQLAVWAGVLLGIAATAGHLQPVLFILLVLVFDTLYHLALAGLARSARPSQPAPPVRSACLVPLAALAITVLVGSGLAGLVLVPSYEMSRYTLRAGYDYAQASQYSLAPAQWVGLLVPAFFGRDPAVHWGTWDRVEIGYAGVLTLVLAALALLGQPSRANRWLGLLAGFSLLVAMGGYTILHGWLFQFVPGLGSMRAPARFVFVLDFALAGLASLGLRELIHQPEQSRAALRRMLRTAPWVLGALVLFAMPLAYYAVITSQDKDAIIFARTSAAANGLAFFIGMLAASWLLLFLSQRRILRPLAAGGLAASLLFLDLASLGSSVYVGQADPTRAFDHPAIIDFLKSDTSLYRIDSRTGVWHLWQPDTGLLHGVFDVAGLVNPLSLADYDRYLNGIPSRSSPLYDFLNAKYVIAAKDVVLDWQKFVPVFDADPALNVYLNRRSLPRALLVHQATSVHDHEAAFAALQSPDFDPANRVVLEEGEALAAVPTEPGTIHFDGYQPNSLQLSVVSPADGYLVLSEAWYPGWQATVDGQPVPVLRANYAFRAIRLSPGAHQVALTFAPQSWPIGLVASALTLLGVVIWAFLRFVTGSV